MNITLELEGVRFFWATVLTQLLVELAPKIMKNNTRYEEDQYNSRRILDVYTLHVLYTLSDTKQIHAETQPLYPISYAYLQLQGHDTYSPQHPESSVDIPAEPEPG